MLALVSKRYHSQSDAEAFFSDRHPFSLPGAVLGLIAVTNVASTVVMLFAT